MAVVASYRRALERVYTLVGAEYALVVVAVNPDSTGSNSAARELVLTARSISSEAKVEAGVRQVVKGPVVRYDLISDQPGELALKPEDIRSSFGGRTLPIGTPLVVALVGVLVNTITNLGEPGCDERIELSKIVTGGYLALNYEVVLPAKLAGITICERQERPVLKRGTKLPTPPDPGSRFLIGEERIDPVRLLTYAIRIHASAPVVAAVQRPPAARAEPVLAPVMKAIRSTRWQRTESAPPAPSTGPAWEMLVQSVVEREVNKIITSKVGREEVVRIDLGDGLVARVWPDLVAKIAGAKDWVSVFTHQSVDPTPRANYEAFETLGDKVLSLSLVHYLLSTTDPTRIIDSNGLTDSHKDILSKVRQPAMAQVMGLSQTGLIRSTVAIDDQMLEDVHEAFFGCLFTVANRLTDGGNQGLPISEALFRVILHQSFPRLDPWAVPKDPQTTLDQIFIKMGWGHPLLNYNEETKITTIRLTRDAQAFLESVGPPVRSDKPFVVGPKAADKPSSARAAAELALNSLKLGWGIDSRYASIAIRSRLMRDDRYARVQREALAIAQKLGFTDIYVARRAKNHNQLYAVMGVRPDDSEAQLHIYKYQTPESRDDEDSGLSTRVAAYITALRGFIGLPR